MANSGPMAMLDKNMIIFAYAILTGAATSVRSVPPVIAMASTPRMGRLTPVMQKPNVAMFRLLPAKYPNSGGNSRLPAPKNEENKTRLTGISLPRERELFIKITCYENENALVVRFHN